MLKKVVRKVWKILPNGLRLKIIRTTQAKFTVSVAAVITNEKDEVLILNHVLRPFSGWGLPGGFIDYGEQPENAIRREIIEEAGIELEELRLFMVRIINSHVEMLFLAKALGTAEVKSREIIELGWFALDDLPENMSIEQKSIIKKVLESGV